MMGWSIFWFLVDLFLSAMLLVAVVGLVAKAALLVRLQHLHSLGDKRKVWREAVEVAGTGACVSLFVQHPRVILVLVFASALFTIWYWQRKGLAMGGGQ
jgi:hypothetical protein